MEYSDPHNVNIMFKQLIEELSIPLLSSENFNYTFNFIKNELKPLYENNNDVKSSIEYLNEFIQELNKNNDETNDNKLNGLTLIVDKYLCVTPENKNHIESNYAIIQYIMQACFNQILQQLFCIINKRNMDSNDIDNALNLFKDIFKDAINGAKGYKMSEKIIEY